MHNGARVHRPAQQHGFGLIEVMVGMVIGLITVIIIMQVFAMAEGYRRTTTSGADAQTNGLLALRTLESEIRMAGYGLTSAGTYVCPKINSYFNDQCTGGTGALTTITTQPVIIIDGGTASDTLQVLYSGSNTGYAPITITSVPATSSNVTKVNTTDGLNACDMILYASRDGTKQCTLMQVTGIAGNNLQFTTASGQNNSCWNPNGGLNDTIYPAQGWTTNDVIINLGNRINRQYAVNKTNGKDEYFLRRTNLAGAADGCLAADPNPTADMIGNIVNIQAQYGVAPASSQTVDCWTDAVDQSANTTVPSHCRVNWVTSSVHQVDPADVKRIKAIRISLVARSSLAEKPSTPGGSCDTTTTAPISWYSTASSNPAPTINLTSDANWQCYRYKVYQSIIPLINVIWANT